MTKTILLLTLLLSLFCIKNLKAQIVINEISNKNSGQIIDEDNEFDDWIEIYNSTDSAVNLANYYLSDDSLNLQKYALPAIHLASDSLLIVFASGKNRTPVQENNHWESAILPKDTFDYLIPNALTPANWMDPTFDISGWAKGKAGFGYSDNDDVTIIPTGTMAVYVRKSFTLPAGFKYQDIALNVDFDDGFVAYLNGVEIARSNVAGVPTWNSKSIVTREALIYSGGKPERFMLDTTLVKSLLVPGDNVFAIEGHNYINTSNDMSLIPFLSFLISDSLNYFEPTPAIATPKKSDNLHANFKINGEGEKIYLYNKNNDTSEMVWVKNLSPGWSIGRVTDGAEQFGIFLISTPSKPNTTKSYSFEHEPNPSFSLNEGYYSGKQSIRLSTTSSTAQIRYTTNGSEPLVNSTLYNGTPIQISATSVIRATSYSKADKLASQSVSNTYFINNNGHSVPLLSIATDNSNLYGGTGIFDNYLQEWEKPCYVEYFDAKGQKQFEQFSGIQIDGGAGGSRSNPQHSFRLEFDNNNYGDAKVKYPLIPEVPDRTDYKSIYIRNGSNQWRIFQFKDAMETEMMGYLTHNYFSHCHPVVVYINGGYFGLYEMREKLNDEYFKENYKAEIDSSFHLLSLSYFYKSTLRALNGSIDTFTTDYNNFVALKHTDINYLQKADQILDLDYYTDYIIAQSWIADNDWPFNNIKIVKGGFTNNRWRFILQDLEWALNPNGWTTSGFDHIRYMLNYDQNMPYIRFWIELIKDQNYKKKFINRFADIMNSAYLPENTTRIAQEVYDKSYTEMRAEYVKWGGGESQANTKMAEYENNLTIFKSELNKRTDFVRQNIVSNFKLTGMYTTELQIQPENAGIIHINTISPEVYPWTGVYFTGVPIKLEAEAMGNYVFDGWEPNNLIKDINNPVIETDVKINGYKFIAKFRKKTPEIAITISEINYNSGDDFPASDWVELFNYGTTDINLDGWYLTDIKSEHLWTLPASAIPANGRLVLASNLSKFSSVYPEVKNVLGSFEFGLGTPSDSVQLFNNKDQLVAGVKYSSETPWPAETSGLGRTIELKDPNVSLNLAANWFAGCLGGSPGNVFQDCSLTANNPVNNEITAKLYPNPAKNELNIVLPSGLISQNISYRIFDVMGKVCQTKMLNQNLENGIKINVSNLPDGIYLIQLSTGKLTQSLKFIRKKE